MKKNINEITSNTSSSNKDKQEKLINEENKLQKSIDEKVSSLDKKYAKNQSDTAYVNQKNNLENIKSKSENRENESKQILVSEIKKEIKTDEIISQADKNYAKEIKSIQSDTKLSNEEKINKEIQLEEKLQENLSLKIKANEKKFLQKKI
jgi:hypothetical protein